MNRLICDDNLLTLKMLEAESIDLCYIDPPFFTNKNYEVIWNDGAEIRQFEDRWVKEGEGRYSKDINVYLNFMQPRIEEIYRVLKKTGSFYLHCDYHASHYLKVLCDQVFGYNYFNNEIIWNYHDPAGTTKTAFKKKHDTILFYVKGNNWTFNTDAVREPYGKKTQHDGEVGAISFGRETKTNPLGKVREDVWQIPIINSMAKERLGYPTQKPESLLEIIIKASSNENDVVLDCFCGCGTTLAVAKRLNRQYIGIDVSPTACRLVAKRIGINIHAIEGIPLTVDEIALLSGWEFQNYIIHLLTLDQSKITVNNKGADGGIDGYYYNELISVKKYKAGRKDLDEFVATIYRNKKKNAIFIALDFTSDFLKEIARLQREQQLTIHHFTLEQIINGEQKAILRQYRDDLLKYARIIND